MFFLNFVMLFIVMFVVGVKISTHKYDTFFSKFRLFCPFLDL